MDFTNETYFVRGESGFSPVYFGIKGLKGIVREIPKRDSLTERILFEKGEIVITVKNGRLDAYSRRYLPGNKPAITYHCSKKIRQDLSSEEALSNAKMSIMLRLSDYEMNRRAKEDIRELQNYFRAQELKLLKSKKGNNAFPEDEPIGEGIAS